MLYKTTYIKYIGVFEPTRSQYFPQCCIYQIDFKYSVFLTVQYWQKTCNAIGFNARAFPILDDAEQAVLPNSIQMPVANHILRVTR